MNVPRKPLPMVDDPWGKNPGQESGNRGDGPRRGCGRDSPGLVKSDVWKPSGDGGPEKVLQLSAQVAY